MHDGSLDWWHPECTATCFIIVSTVEIHRLILDVCVCLHKLICFLGVYFFIDLIVWIPLKRLKMVYSATAVLL